ncbi:ArsA family ATPase [Rhodococcus chondri]|uniref:ArsA-related P-loop ATPase n=1 Tax=Rhodococcus chondri TaxID=3065941 RepID=A0ABU7JNC7_9NOCA|nr:ArsA-related P-loop ATPase [Rhodococcus sp. CC-R104]MEE2031541.1 ArsA-related P-loop ATPase [Rhodococcus sp. CC-R104]
MPARVRLFVGKGGAGKSTLAAATALAAARVDKPVLLVSIDQAHSLTDVLDTAPDTGVRAVEDGLDVLEIDSLALLEDRFSMLSGLMSLAGAHDHAGPFELPAPAELTGLPGIQELLALAEVARLADDGRWHTLIVDAPASADAFRTLAAPRMVADYVERIWPQHRRVEAATGPDTRLAMVVALFDRVLASIHGTCELFEDRERITATLVSTPDRAGFAEFRRIRSWLALSGLRLDRVMVNGILPDLAGEDGAAAQWLETCRTAQREVVTRIVAAVDGVPVVECERRAAEPVGLAPLREFGAVLVGNDSGTRVPSGADPIRVQHESGAGVDAVYAMRMHLPLADPASLTLGRVDDDLVIGADGIRRRLRLASGLRRCTVSAAEFDGSDLIVRFVPDPAVWPR